MYGAQVPFLHNSRSQVHKTHSRRKNQIKYIHDPMNSSIFQLNKYRSIQSKRLKLEKGREKKRIKLIHRKKREGKKNGYSKRNSVPR